MKNFINIYVEHEALNYQLTKDILSQNSNANVITIGHYKDVFSRPRQDVLLQKETQSLILAVKKDEFLYKGAPVCQDFGNQNFYYCSSVMNCVCNCEYCFLKGMYESGNLVVFVNLEDYFAQIKNDNKYICISYDTDLFPLESMLGYVKKWLDFARVNNEVTLEVRTKCKNLDV